MKNGKMFEMVISDEIKHSFESLIYNLKRETAVCGGVFTTNKENNRFHICMAVSEKLKPYFVERAKDEISSYIAVEHKFDYFMQNLGFFPLEKNKKVGFCSALAVFDKSTDIKYIKEHLLFESEINIDSALHFCMPELFERWKEIANLIAENKIELSGENGALEMMRFLLKSTPCENESLHLIASNGFFAIVNDKKETVYEFNQNEQEKLLHRAICLLPKHLALHGNNFDFFYELFPSNKNEMSLTK